MLTGNMWFLLELLLYLILAAVIFGFLGWWLRGLFSSPKPASSEEKGTHQSANSDANARDREKIKKLETQLKNSESALQAIRSQHDSLQKASAPRETLDQAQQENAALKEAAAAAQKQAEALASDLKRAQATAATLNAKVNEGSKSQQAATLALQNDLAKTKEELARASTGGAALADLKKELEQVRESLAMANRSNSELRKSQATAAAALAACEARHSKVQSGGTALQDLFAQTSASSVPPAALTAAKQELKAEADQAAAEQAAKLAAEKAAAEQAAKLAAEKAAAEQAAKLAAERAAAEQAAKLATEKTAAERAQKEAAEKILAEAAAKLAAEKSAAEQASRTAPQAELPLFAANDTPATTAPETPLSGSQIPAAAAILGKRVVADDLLIVEGIGPKIKALIEQAGVNTWQHLADTSVERLQEILQQAGPSFEIHNPGTWPRQAALARDGKWEELKTWQDQLEGGKE